MNGTERSPRESPGILNGLIVFPMKSWDSPTYYPTGWIRGNISALGIRKYRYQPGQCYKYDNSGTTRL